MVSRISSSLRLFAVKSSIMQRTPYRIVLTGGPCAGKTTALSHIAEQLRSSGYAVFLVPEAATLLLAGGCRFIDRTPDQQLHFQEHLLSLALSMEYAFAAIARNVGQPAVLLCDRGAMDGSAYLEPEQWQILLNRGGWNVADLRDGRYDAVIHLVSAAHGAESFYTTENNAARKENLEQARNLEQRLRDAWFGHPRLIVIDNS